MKRGLFAAVVASGLLVAVVPATTASGNQTGTALTATAHTVSSTTDFQVNPVSIGTPGDAEGWCLLTSGTAFSNNDVWTCYVAVLSNASSPLTWTAIGPTGCAPGCKTTFSPSGGTLAPGRGVWVKIMTAMGGCANYTLSFKTRGTTVSVPVVCG